MTSTIDRLARWMRAARACAGAAALLAGAGAAVAAKPVVPAVAASGAAAPDRVSPYALANRSHAAAAASAPAGLPSLPPSMRHGRQGLPRNPQPGFAAAGS